jgi:hypothetical protein
MNGERTLVELDDPWHPPGYRITVPMGAPPEDIVTWAIGDITEEPDPVTMRRPSDVRTGQYLRDGEASDGTPVYRWKEKA